MSLPWIPSTSKPASLEQVLKANGWQLWWNDQGIRLTGPRGYDRLIPSNTTSNYTLRDAYEAAREHSQE